MGHPDENSSVYELKAYVENVFARLGLHMHDLVVGNLTDDIYAAGLSVQTKGGKRLATFGIVTKKLLKHSILTTRFTMPISTGKKLHERPVAMVKGES